MDYRRESRPLALPAIVCLAAALGGCASAPPIPGVRPVDHLIEPGEVHFARLWQVTERGNNAEGYWSFAGDRLSLQREADGAKCDRIFVTHETTGELLQISNGKGRTTCAYFMPGDREVLYASTHEHMEDCPPPVDWKTDGYVWLVHPEYDIFVHDLATGAERKLTGDRSGDLELWTCALDGSDLRQVTDELGYDGGAFFSHDGRKIVFRATRFVDEGDVGTREQYVDLIAKHKIRPHKLDLYVCDADGSNRRRVTDLGGASWAPYFFPGDRRIIFSTNHHDPSERKGEFDLFAVDADGSNLEPITTYKGFDSFPMFSPDGRYLVFASNRGGTEPGETNLFIAEWR
jgi:Tol biopolymer transport system component